MLNLKTRQQMSIHILSPKLCQNFPCSFFRNFNQLFKTGSACLSRGLSLAAPASRHKGKKRCQGQALAGCGKPPPCKGPFSGNSPVICGLRGSQGVAASGHCASTQGSLINHFCLQTYWQWQGALPRPILSGPSHLAGGGISREGVQGEGLMGWWMAGL